MERPSSWPVVYLNRRGIKSYTEQAVSALGGVPSVVYLPPMVRPKTRMSADGVTTDAPYSVDEIGKRIVEADPAGFLIAIMNGQPLPVFSLRRSLDPSPLGGPATTEEGVEGYKRHIPPPPYIEVNVDFVVPSIEERMEVAKFLMRFTPIKKPQKSAPPTPKQEAGDEFERLMDMRAKQELDNSS